MAHVRGGMRPAPGYAAAPTRASRRASKETVMRELITYIVFGWYPYLCLTVFLLGSWSASTASSTPGAADRASCCAAGS